MKLADKLYSNRIVIGYCLFISVIMLMIGTKSSPLYPINDWADPNCYFTMGKSMFHGKVLYQDILDHKGPYIFLLYGLASIMSSTTFIGVFVLEILSWSIFLFYNFKISLLYLDKKQGFILLPLLSAVILASDSFYYGGSAEEFCLPFLAIGLYYFMEYFSKSYPMNKMSYSKILKCGIFAGILFWIKFNLLGFYFAWLLILVIIEFMNHDYKEAVKICLIFTGGMFIASLPWLLYFGFNGALVSLWNEYFYKNIFLYGSGESMSLLNKIIQYAEILKHNFRVNYGYFIFLLIGFCYFIFNKKVYKMQKLGIFMMTLCSFLLIYIGRVWNYYALPLSVFTVLGFIPIFLVFREKYQNGKRILMIAYMVSIMVSLIFIYCNSVNIEYLGKPKEEQFQYELKNIIGESEDNSLLLYGIYDFGIYTMCDIVPSSKYFFQNNMEDEEREAEWRRYISEGRTKYILTNETYPKEIYEHYSLVYNDTVILERRDKDIYLFKKDDRK